MRSASIARVSTQPWFRDSALARTHAETHTHTLDGIGRLGWETRRSEMPTSTDASHCSPGGDLLLFSLHPFEIYVAAVVFLLLSFPSCTPRLFYLASTCFASFLGLAFFFFFGSFSFDGPVLERARERARPRTWSTKVEGFNQPGVALRSQCLSRGLLFPLSFFFTLLLFLPTALCYCCCESSDLWLNVFVAES